MLSSSKRPSIEALFLSGIALVLASVVGARDLYSVLDVPRAATTGEIKSAYRRKARETHPDKRDPDVSAEAAAKEFREVVHAFEVLSDAESRKTYDRTGDETGGAGSAGNNGDGGGWGYWNFQHQWMKTAMNLKKRMDVKQAQSRVLHVVSLDQLRTIMLDADGRLERNLLMCFFTPRLEGIVEQEMLYPYPFAGMSSQSIWWEDLLQTVSIRFHRSNELTRYFDVGTSDEMAEPVFVFGKRGALFSEDVDFHWFEDNKNADGQFSIHRTKDGNSFEDWMWNMLEVPVIFNNHHAHPVQLYWIKGDQADLKDVIEPGSSSTHYSRLTHEFHTRDARVDAWPGAPWRSWLGEDTSLGSWKIGVEGYPPIREDGTIVIDILCRECLDLSGHCRLWADANYCLSDPVFMREKCMLSCGYCDNAQVRECRL